MPIIHSLRDQTPPLCDCWYIILPAVVMSGDSPQQVPGAPFLLMDLMDLQGPKVSVARTRARLLFAGHPKGVTCPSAA